MPARAMGNGVGDCPTVEQLPKEAEKLVPESFLERLPDAPQALFTCLDQTWLLACECPPGANRILTRIRDDHLGLRDETNMSKSPIKIRIVDDHPFIRDGFNDARYGRCYRNYPSVNCNESGIREYTEVDIRWVDFIMRMPAIEELFEMGFTHAIFNMPDVYKITPLETFRKDIIPKVAGL
jgi:hypothetical protein